MIRRIVVGVLALCTVVLALATVAEASSVRRKIRLNINDVILVKGTHTICTAQKNLAAAPGNVLIECGYTNGVGRLVPGTFAVGLTADGQVIALVVKPDGSAALFFRTPAAHRAAAKIYTVKVGDYVYVNGSSIFCPITSTNGAITTGCFLLRSNRKVRPNSNGMGITDQIAFVSHFDANLHVTILRTMAQRPAK